MHHQQTENIQMLNSQLFCQQIDQKTIQWQNELLAMFLRRCSYKNSCFSELKYNSSIPVLMI